MLERKLVEHCAPTLAGLKTANLFSYKYDSPEVLQKQLRTVNQKLNKKGVFIEILKTSATGALLYVYRQKRLAEDLKKPGVPELMRMYGYTDQETENCIAHLKESFESRPCFPHEIGLFLSYPLGDVVGFIEQGGKNCKCSGVWKVYCNECEARRQFARFEKCRDVYLRQFINGRSIMQLTIAA